MSERLVTNLQELLAVSTKPLPDIPGLAEELHKSDAEIVEGRKNILNNLLGIIGDDGVWNLLFRASAIHSGDKDLEWALINSSRTITPESAIFVSDYGGKALILIKSAKGAEWGEEPDTSFPVGELTRKALSFTRASERGLGVLCNNRQFFEEILTSLAERFGEAARIPAKMENLAGIKAFAISENLKEINMLTGLAHSLRGYDNYPSTPA